MDAAERSTMIADLAQDHAQVLRAIFDANDDLAERLAASETTLVYDADDDYFAVTLGPPAEAVTESVANSVLLRVDPETLKIVGIVIEDFEQRWKNTPGPWAGMVEYWGPVVDALRSGNDPTEALREVVQGQSLRQLVPA